jgi:hypothetical protein
LAPGGAARSSGGGARLAIVAASRSGQSDLSRALNGWPLHGRVGPSWRSGRGRLGADMSQEAVDKSCASSEIYRKKATIFRNDDWFAIGRISAESGL